MIDRVVTDRLRRVYLQVKRAFRPASVFHSEFSVIAVAREEVVAEAAVRLAEQAHDPEVAAEPGAGCELRPACRTRSSSCGWR